MFFFSFLDDVHFFQLSLTRSIKKTRKTAGGRCGSSSIDGRHFEEMIFFSFFLFVCLKKGTLEDLVNILEEIVKANKLYSSSSSSISVL